MPQVSINDFLKPVFIKFIRLDSVDLSLTIDAENLVPLLTVKALVWKILHACLHLPCDRRIGKLDPMFVKLRDSHHLSLGDIPQEVVVRQGISVEECNEDQVVSGEAAGDEWVWEDVDRHGVVIQAKKLIEPDLLLVDLAPFPLFLAKDTHPELAVIHVAASELLARGVLYTLFDLDVAFIIANLLFEGQLLGLDTKLCNVRSLVILLGHHYRSLRIIRYDHAHNGKTSHHLVLFQQIREDLAVLLEPRIRLHCRHFSFGVFVFDCARHIVVPFILTVRIIVIKCNTPSAGVFLLYSWFNVGCLIFNEHRLFGLDATSCLWLGRLRSFDDIPMGKHWIISFITLSIFGFPALRAIGRFHIANGHVFVCTDSRVLLILRLN